MNSRFWIDFLIMALFILAQIVLFRHLEFWGLQTDVVLIFLVWLASVRERTYTLVLTIAGAFLMDILLDTWGVHLFSKTLLIMLGHGFIRRQGENIKQFGQLFTLFLVLSLVYNMIFLLISAFAGLYSLELQFLKYWLGNSIYIAITAGFMFMIKPQY